MKKKTINAIISKKINEWVESIKKEAESSRLPSGLRDLERHSRLEDLARSVHRDAIVTGGCIASMLLGERVNDFDVYLKTRETALALANHYVEIAGNYTLLDAARVAEEGDRIKVVVKSAGVAGEQPDDEDAELLQDPGTGPQDAAAEPAEEAGPKYHPVFLSSNAITLSGRIQIVLRFIGEPEEIHKNYDFIHCTNYWTQATGVVLNQPALESLLSKELRYCGSKYPLASLFRIRKFINRGWTINAGQILKIALQVSKLDLCDPKILEDQLTGVDVAYFEQLIHAAMEYPTTQDSGTGDRIDTAYLTAIIDRMF